MRWLVVSLLVLAALIFSFRGRYIAQPTDVPNEEKIGVVVLPAQTAAEVSAPKDETMKKSLEISKAVLKDKSQLKDELAANPHATPPAVMKAGLVLGEIAEMEARYPERKEEFIRYYRECFESSETITVTRVQCLKRYIRSAKLDESQKDSLLARLPAPVRRLHSRSETPQ